MDYIWAKTLTGKFTIIHFEEGIEAASLDDLKGKYQDKEGHPPDQQRWIFNSEQLEEGSLLSDYGIKNGTLLHFVSRLRGD